MDKDKIFKDKKSAAIIAIICSILWGSAFPVLKISYQELNMSAGDMNGKIVFAGMRFFLASIILFITVKIIFKQSVKIKKENIMQLILLGIVQTSLQYFFFYNGLANTSGMKGSLLSSIGSFFVVLLAHFIYTDDKINRKKVIGLITGFVGIVLANWGKSFNFDFSFAGEGFMIIAGFIGAIGTIIAKDISKKMSPFLVTAWQMLIGSSLLLIYGIPAMKGNMLQFTPKASMLFIYAAFLSAIAFALWYTLLKYNKAGEITLYKFVIPVAGTMLSAIFIQGEAFTVSLVLALILVAFGIININR